MTPLNGLIHTPPVGLAPVARPSVFAEAQRLRSIYSKAELRKLCSMIGEVPVAKPVVRVVERYYRGVPQKSEE